MHTWANTDSARVASTKRFSWLSETSFDSSALCYGIVLAAWGRGLGKAINGQDLMRSDILREFANILAEEINMACIAMGYPGDSFAAKPLALKRTNALREESLCTREITQPHTPTAPPSSWPALARPSAMPNSKGAAIDLRNY